MNENAHARDRRAHDVAEVGSMSAKIRELLLVFSIEVDEEMATFIDQYVASLNHDARLADNDRDAVRLQLIVEDVRELLTDTEERIARARAKFRADVGVLSHDAVDR